MTPRLVVFGVALGCAVSTAACEGRYANLGEPAQAFARLDTDRSQAFVGDDGAFVWLLVVSEDDLGLPASAIVARIAPDSSVALEFGAYQPALDEGRFEFEVAARFLRAAEPDVSYPDRTGSTSETLVPRITRIFEVETADLPSEIEVRSPELALDVRMFDYDEVLITLDPEDEAELASMFKLLVAPVLLSQARVDRFGSRGITRLITEGPLTVEGLLNGDVTTTVVDSVAPRIDMAFDAVVDLTGLSISGDYVQQTNLNGNGVLEGRLDYELQLSGERILEARMNLEGALVQRGAVRDGQIQLDVSRAECPEAYDDDGRCRLDVTLLYDFGVPEIAPGGSFR